MEQPRTSLESLVHRATARPLLAPETSSLAGASFAVDPNFGAPGLGEYRRGLHNRWKGPDVETLGKSAHDELLSHLIRREPIEFLNKLDSLPSGKRLQILDMHFTETGKRFDIALQAALPERLLQTARGLFYSADAAHRAERVANLLGKNGPPEVIATAIQSFPTATQMAAFVRAWRGLFQPELGSLVTILRERCGIETLEELHTTFHRPSLADTIRFLTERLTPNGFRLPEAQEAAVSKRLLKLSPEQIPAVARAYQLAAGVPLLTAMQRRLDPFLVSAFVTRNQIEAIKQRTPAARSVVAPPRSVVNSIVGETHSVRDLPWVQGLPSDDRSQLHWLTSQASVRAVSELMTFSQSLDFLKLPGREQLHVAEILLRVPGPATVHSLSRIIQGGAKGTPRAGLQLALLRDASGSSLLENLVRILNDEGHSSYASFREKIVVEALCAVADPLLTRQHSFRTCAAAAIEFKLLRDFPSEALRILRQALSRHGLITLTSGLLARSLQVHFRPQAGDERSFFSRTMQSLLMDFANGDNLSYRVDRDHHAVVGGMNSEDQGSGTRSGLSTNAIVHALEGTLGGRHLSIDVPALGSAPSSEFLERIQHTAPIVVLNTASRDTQHAVALLSIDPSSVTLFDSAFGVKGKEHLLDTRSLRTMGRTEFMKDLAEIICPVRVAETALSVESPMAK